jgi:hypothetical protein
VIDILLRTIQGSYRSPVKLLIKRNIVNELCDERSHILAFPLRSHVANTVDGCKCESAVLLKIT